MIHWVFQTLVLTSLTFGVALVCSAQTQPRPSGQKSAAPAAKAGPNGMKVGEEVEVTIAGGWDKTKIIDIVGDDFTVLIPGSQKTAIVHSRNLRRIEAPKPAAPVKVGVPPKAGMTSCAGKFEGRYSDGSAGNFNIAFRAGKATLSMFGDKQEMECWMGGGKMILHPPDNENIEIDINDDGSLDTPMGQIKRRSN